MKLFLDMRRHDLNLIKMKHKEMKVEAFSAEIPPGLYPAFTLHAEFPQKSIED